MKEKKYYVLTKKVLLAFSQKMKKPLRDTFEALGHAQAYDFMFTLTW
jgi:hypothetical protein